MEKVKLNNQVVLMRKYVKQAKVHSINKLSKQVKLLQNRKGSEIQVLKAKRKAERYLEEISLLKKIKPDYVSKLALSKAKAWKEILLQKNSTLEDRCIAILASYEPVQKEVEVFHNSNKDLVSKISNLIKQWEEKNKFPKDSFQKKRCDFKKLQNNANMVQIKVAGGPLCNMTDQSEASDNETCKSLNKSLLIENSNELKSGNRKSKKDQNEKLATSLKSSKKFPQSKELSDVSNSAEDPDKNLVENEESNEMGSKKKKVLDIDEDNELGSDVDSTSEDQTNSSVSSNNSVINDPDIEKHELENDNSELEGFLKNELETENTETGDNVENVNVPFVSELNKDSLTKQSVAMSNDKNFATSCSLLVKKQNPGSKSGENKLKAIAILNLDDFRDLDEFPLNDAHENKESTEEESSDDHDDSPNNASQNDPFFLGRDEAVFTANKLVDDPKTKHHVSMNEVFERKEKSSNQYNYKKNFNKPLNSPEFSNKYSSEFRAKKNSRTWKKDKFEPRDLNCRFQHNRKNSCDRENSDKRFQPYKSKTFDRDSTKNNKAFNKNTFHQPYWNNKHSNANDLCDRSGDNSFRKNKQSKEKNDVSSKPLHPSWEAKRKQKELINTSFQGKKTVFED